MTKRFFFGNARAVAGKQFEWILVFARQRSRIIGSGLKFLFLVRHGFLFQKIYRDLGGGLWCRVRYPKTLEQAKDFVLEFKDQALKIHH